MSGFDYELLVIDQRKNTTSRFLLRLGLEN